jgi:hypothetical protein
MSERKRVNISIDPQTYNKLQHLTNKYKFKNVCELLVSFTHILLDRMEGADNRKYDIPDDDGEYIDSMFAELGSMFAELGSMPASGAKDKDMQISNYTKKKVIKGYGKR